MLGDVGENAPDKWEKPLGTPDVHVGLVAVATDTARLEALLERARTAYQEIERRQSDLAAGLLLVADRARALRVQGRH